MRYIAQGVTSPHGANYELVGKTVYIQDAGGWHIWGPRHKATRFDSRAAAWDAAHKATGPFFKLPDPETIEVLEVT